MSPLPVRVRRPSFASPRPTAPTARQLLAGLVGALLVAPAAPVLAGGDVEIDVVERDLAREGF